MYKLQGSFPGYQFSSPTTFKQGVGWHNQGDPDKVEQVTFSGNIVEVYLVQDGKYFIKTVSIDENPPAKLVMPTPDNLHPLIHLLTTQYSDHLDMTTNDRFPRIILFSNPGERLWMDPRDLERVS